MGDTSADLGPVAAFDLLSEGRRVAAVVAVREADRPVSSDELAAMTTAAEYGRSPGWLGGRSSRSVKATLENDHLPRLVAHDVLRDADGGYEAGANMEGLLAVIDAGLTRFETPGGLATGQRRPGDPGGPTVPDRASTGSDATDG